MSINIGSRDVLLEMYVINNILNDGKSPAVTAVSAFSKDTIWHVATVNI